MKYYPRLKIYKASNVTFDPESMVADSYNWWNFVQKINGYVVFNNYFYSRSTRKHQAKVRSVLNQLNINIDVEVNISMGLQACYGENSFKELGINALNEALYSQDYNRAYKIAKIFKLKLTQKMINEAIVRKEEDLCDQYLERAYQYQQKKEISKSKLLKSRKELKKSMVLYLENNCAFRAYRILPAKYFRKINKPGIHHLVSFNGHTYEIDDAISTFCRDGYSMIYFYI